MNEKKYSFVFFFIFVRKNKDFFPNGSIKLNYKYNFLILYNFLFFGSNRLCISAVNSVNTKGENALIFPICRLRAKRKSQIMIYKNK